MKAILYIGFGTLLAASAHAQSFASPAADIGAGKKRAAVCFACHGAEGISKIPGTPHLAGQDRSYLENALRAYRDGQRQHPTMNAMAKPLSDRDIANIAAYFSLQNRMNDGQTAAQALETFERIRPIGTVAVGTPATSAVTTSDNATSVATTRSGETVYNASCMACHNSGAAGAPKLGDKEAWAPRLRQGEATLVQHALHGFQGMPAKGGCTNCSEAEIAAAVQYLMNMSK